MIRDRLSKLTGLQILFILAIVYKMVMVFCQFSYPILEQHSFRQTQTATTVYWMLKGGPWFKYQTPTLGFPWSVPFEFPLYQWIVAIVYKVLPFSLDQSGRLVSIIFSYLCLFPIYYICKGLKKDVNCFFITSILFLVCPNILYWSHTFMMESTVLLLSLAYIAAGLFFLNYSKFRSFIICLVFGVLSALSKITIFVPATYFLFGLVLLNWYKDCFSLSRNDFYKYACVFLTVLVPVLAAMAWTHFADAQKSQNLIAKFYTSKALFAWNFGTLSQRLSMSFWLVLFRRFFRNVSYLPVLLAFCIYHGRDFKASQLYIPVLGFLAFLAGWLTFSNLLYVHSYYSFEVLPYVLISVGFLFNELYAIASKSAFYKILIISIIMSILPFFLPSGYFKTIFQNTCLNRDYRVGKFIKENTKSNTFILVYGIDWSSTISYYAKRKSMTDSMKGDWMYRLRNLKRFQGGLPLSSIVMCGSPVAQTNVESRSIIAKLSKGFLLKRIDNCDIYYKRK